MSNNIREIDDLDEYRNKLSIKMINKEVDQVELLGNNVIIYFKDGSTFECYSDATLFYHLYE